MSTAIFKSKPVHQAISKTTCPCCHGEIDFSMLCPQCNLTIEEIIPTPRRREREKTVPGVLAELTLDSDWMSIPKGQFLMGSHTSEVGRNDDEQQHLVKVSSFKMLKTAIPNILYHTFAMATGRNHLCTEFNELRPVTGITFFDAVDFANWFSQQTGWKCRLPTEAEWEYAARAGSQSAFYSGTNISTSEAVFDGDKDLYSQVAGINWGHAMPCGHFNHPNPFQLHDMNGNVHEWTASFYSHQYNGMEQEDSSDEIINMSGRSIRGGCFKSKAASLRSASRKQLRPDTSNIYTGFRLIRED